LAKRNATIATTATLSQQKRRRGEILEQKWLKVRPAADGSGVQIFFLFSFPYFLHFQCHGPCGVKQQQQQSGQVTSANFSRKGSMELFNERIPFYNVGRLLTNEGVGLTD